MIINSNNPLDVRVDRERAEVCFNEDAQGLFQIGVETGIAWRRFGEHLNEKRGMAKADWQRAFDFYALEAAAIGIRRDKHLGVADLQAFRIGEDGYGPSITRANL